MHKPAAYAYQFSFSSSFRFVDEDKSDRFYIGSASGKFVTGPNARIAFKLSDIELGKGSFGSGFTVYGSAGSPLIAESIQRRTSARRKQSCWES